MKDAKFMRRLVNKFEENKRKEEYDKIMFFINDQLIPRIEDKALVGETEIIVSIYCSNMSLLEKLLIDNGYGVKEIYNGKLHITW